MWASMGDAPDSTFPASTIDEAELAGWDYLAASCRCGTTMIPWRLLRRETRYRRLDEIAARLKCKQRGCAPTRVWLYWRGGRDANQEMEKTILEVSRQ